MDDSSQILKLCREHDDSSARVLSSFAHLAINTISQLELAPQYVNLLELFYQIETLELVINHFQQKEPISKMEFHVIR
ncbi:hypothetical protein FGO68_gene4200 [Halteria grandinella]|uniref:Uncharacterized protein n=1 Tax=Halteria grandinella TaxID=5974 RepID=A0A8J8P8A6_HALGN|nr:hypothetical protein FGO68_gene4200 [Halteria grandinella]